MPPAIDSRIGSVEQQTGTNSERVTIWGKEATCQEETAVWAILGTIDPQESRPALPFCRTVGLRDREIRSLSKFPISSGVTSRCCLQKKKETGTQRPLWKLG